jgi:hypothetical protein
MTIHFHYDAGEDRVALLSANCREGGHLQPGEGAFGHAIEAFRVAAFGQIVPDAGAETYRLVSARPSLRLVPREMA